MATRLQLRDRARARADQDGSDFPSDSAYNSFIDEGAKEVFADLVMSGWPIDSSTTTINATASQSVYTFGGADAVFAVTMVYTNFGGQFAELRRVNPGHMAALRSTGAIGGISNYYEVRTRVAGPVIELFPRVAGTYFVDYIVDFPGFTSDSDVWLGPPRSDELIVLRAAAKGIRKESRVQDAQAIDNEYSGLLLKVKELASWFDMRNPAEIRDSRPMIDPISTRDFGYFAGPGGVF